MTTTRAYDNGANGQKRIYGSGIIETYGDRFRARVRKPDGTKPTLDIFDKWDDAAKALDNFFAVAATSGGWKTGKPCGRSATRSSMIASCSTRSRTSGPRSVDELDPRRGVRRLAYDSFQ